MVKAANTVARPRVRPAPVHRAKHRDETKSLANEIMAMLAKLSVRFSEDDGEMEWMAQNTRNPVIAEMLQDTTVVVLHVLEAIGQLEPVNGITISKQFGIPKGSVSKITRRLIDQKLIVKESLPNNRKEILFRMTPLGRELFNVHRAMHQHVESGLIQFLQRYDADELRFLVRVLQDLMDMPRSNLEFKPDVLDQSRE